MYICIYWHLSKKKKSADNDFNLLFLQFEDLATDFITSTEQFKFLNNFIYLNYNVKDM
jgi:hypothetical protein